MSPVIDSLRVIFGLAFLCYASYTDLKIRRVKNEVWISMGFIGGIFLLMQLILEKRGWEYYLIFVPVGILFASMLLDHEPLYDGEKKTLNFKLLGLYIIGIVVLIYQISLLYGENYFYHLLTIPILILVFFGFYHLRILHGGADAKALMTIAIFVPFYPHFLNLPLIQIGSERMTSAMELFFPFAILVLMNSVFFIVWVFVALLIYNSAKRDMGLPEMLLGYKMDIDRIDKKYVWAMERIVDGERVMVLFPRKEDEESLIKLKEMDAKRIWVTPKIPFIVFLTAGFAISAFIGNIFVAIFGLFG